MAQSLARPWHVYVIVSESAQRTYVGCTTDPARRLRQHNGEIRGGAKSTRACRPWSPGALYGTYRDRSEAMKAERALKRRRGKHRMTWEFKHSPWCRGRGPLDEWVTG